MRSVLALDHFARWVQDPVGHFPVAVLDDEAAGLVGASARVVRLSDETVGKQARNHDDITVGDYRILPDIIEKCGIITSGGLSLAYYHDAGKIYGAVVKATGDGCELFVTTLHRIGAADIRRWLRRGRRVRDPLA